MSTALRTYYRGANLVSLREHPTGQTRYYHSDYQGTTQCLTDSAGTVTDRFACDAWGVEVKRTGSSLNRQWYIGNWGYYRQVDQALEYVRARYLGTARGQWLSVDPLSTNNSATGLFKYAYAGSSPSRNSDPSGLLPVAISPPSRSKCLILGILGFNASGKQVRDVVEAMTARGWPGTIFPSAATINTLSPYQTLISMLLVYFAKKHKCLCIVAYSWGGGTGWHVAQELRKRKFQGKKSFDLKAVATIDPIRNTPTFPDTEHRALASRYAGAEYHQNHYAGSAAKLPLDLPVDVVGGPILGADINVPWRNWNHINIQNVGAITGQVIAQFVKRCEVEDCE